MTSNTATEKLESAKGQQTGDLPATQASSPTHKMGSQDSPRNEIIEYVYSPKKGKTQRVCGILGKDKQETIQFVKKGFPDLAEVEIDRFDFQVYNRRGNWVTVLEEAWEAIRWDMPSIWIVIVQELPEEREQHYDKPFCSPGSYTKIPGVDETGIKRNSRRWKSHLLACLTVISVTIFAGAVGIANGTLRGHLQTGAITGAVYLFFQVIIGDYLIK